jgi:hypothetical protein
VRPKDIRVMGHCGKHMISPKEAMVDPKCPPSEIHRTWDVISRCTLSASSTAWKQSSDSAELFHLHYTRMTSWHSW